MGKQKVPQKVLVTGGGGFLGSAIVKLLVHRGDEVTSFSRNNYPHLATLDVLQVCGDIRDYHAVEIACRGKDLVFHVAAKPGVWGDYSTYFAVNVTGTRHVIAACRKCNVHRLVYTSSPSVIFGRQNIEGLDETAPYPDRYLAHYPKTKAIAEREIRRTAGKGLRTITLRPHLIWGPGDNHLVPRILQRAKHLKQVGDGRNLVDTLYIDNAADAHVLAADKLEINPTLSGNVYFISQGQPVLLWDMVNEILKAGGFSPVKKIVPHKVAWLTGAILEGLYKLFHLPGEPRMTRFVVNELAASHWFDIGAAQRDLGYTPRVSMEQGLVRLADWLKDE